MKAHKLILIAAIVCLPSVGASQSQPPTADAGPPVIGEVGVPLSFDGSNSSSPNGIIVEYGWFWDDGTQGGSGGAPTHTYDEPGIYDVSLTVTDISGASDSDSTTAIISLGTQPPTADAGPPATGEVRSAEHTSELQTQRLIAYAVSCLT